MGKKNYIVFIILLIFYLQSFYPITQANKDNFSKDNFIDLSENHLIEGVPYIAQTEGYFCYYSSITMILNHLGYNTTLDEILFYDGLGYTHHYIPEERLPHEGCYADIDFLFSLFGVETERWFLEFDESGDEKWQEYYLRLKQNISDDVPIITAVDPFSLPSLRDQFGVSDMVWNFMFPSGVHVIVIVGYNDSNQSICYNDPNAGFYGDGSYGDYDWISLEDYKSAVENCRWESYYISIIQQKNESLTDKERFEHAFDLNIEKLKSNYTGYEGIYGIDASKRLKMDYSDEQLNSSDTIDMYKEFGGNGIRFTLLESLVKTLSLIIPDTPNIFDISIIGQLNAFESIASEKNHVADYLENSLFYPNLCMNQSQLLREEADKWDELSDLFKIFMRRGMFLLNFRAKLIINQMKELMDDIINLEETIVLGQR